MGESVWGQGGASPKQTPSPMVLKIVGKDATTPQSARQELANRLTLIGPADERLIFEYLLSPAKTSVSMIETRESERRIKNALMNRLRHSAIKARKQFEVYRKILQSEQLDPVTREYASQHIASLLLREDCPTSLHFEILNLLIGHAKANVETTIAGSILMSLNQVCQAATFKNGGQTNSKVPKPRLLEACQAIGTNQKSSVANIATSVAVTGDLSVDDGAASFPEWVIDVFEEHSKIRSEGEEILGAELIVLSCARVLLDTEDEGKKALVRVASKRLGNATLPGQLLRELLKQEQPSLDTQGLP